MKDFVIGTHYYGLSEDSWPVNYLNSIRNDQINGDLKKIKDLGFNTIILLASWSEFEPKIGQADENVYQKINLIIKAARSQNIKVIIRIPYLWSLKGGEIRERISYALIEHGAYRSFLIKFLKDFQSKVVQDNDNVVMKFGSWEDFYVLRDLFFSAEPPASQFVQSAFSRDTGIKADGVQRNGENFDHLMQWIDSRIRQLTIEIGNEIGGYGYEIRSDADPFTVHGKKKWHIHDDFYKNEANGDLVVYWAPYFGQINNGESINSRQANESFSWMLDSIAAKTSQPPFVDQLNFFDNSPGTEKNAKISEDEYKYFFEKLSTVVAERTTGYSFWTIRDYRHNIVYNPVFSEGLKGWSGKHVIFNNRGALIARDGYLAQDITRDQFRLLKGKNAILVVDVVSGNAVIDFESVGKFLLTGPGRYELPISALSHGDSKITVRSKLPLGSQHLIIRRIGIYGHAQNGKILDYFGKPSKFFKLIKGFNLKVASLVEKKCLGFNGMHGSKLYFVRGFFSDGWTGSEFDFCLAKAPASLGLRVVYLNPSLERRVITLNTGTTNKIKIALTRGEGSIQVCPPRGSTLDRFSISILPPYIPGIEDRSSLDLRELGVFIKKVERYKCR